MEDTLRVVRIPDLKGGHQVLILVLMEDTLRGDKHIYMLQVCDRLNPCFNGRYSQRKTSASTGQRCLRLNPCFNGRYSQRLKVVYYFVDTKS